MRSRQNPCRLRRAVRSQLGKTTTEAEFFRTLADLLRERQELGRGENLVPWFCRAVHRVVHKETLDRNAMIPTPNVQRAEHPSSEQIWAPAVCDLVLRLLPRINARYAEIIRRVELEGEMKLLVAAELRVSKATFNVMLHRARRALRREFEHYCDGATRDSGQQ